MLGFLIFIQKPAMAFSKGPQLEILKLKFRIQANLKKHEYLGPLEFFENDNFNAQSPKHAKILDFDL